MKTLKYYINERFVSKTEKYYIYHPVGEDFRETISNKKYLAKYMVESGRIKFWIIPTSELKHIYKKDKSTAVYIIPENENKETIKTKLEKGIITLSVIHEKYTELTNFNEVYLSERFVTSKKTTSYVVYIPFNNDWNKAKKNSKIADYYIISNSGLSVYMIPISNIPKDLTFEDSATNIFKIPIEIQNNFKQDFINGDITEFDIAEYEKYKI